MYAFGLCCVLEVGVGTAGVPIWKVAEVAEVAEVAAVFVAFGETSRARAAAAAIIAAAIEGEWTRISRRMIMDGRRSWNCLFRY